LELLRALKLLLTAFDVELVLFDVFEWFVFADNACVGVTLICDDFVLEDPLVELLVVFVVLLVDEDDVEVELLELRVAELDADFELFRFVDEEEV
jgi:hypothetical protein